MDQLSESLNKLTKLSLPHHLRDAFLRNDLGRVNGENYPIVVLMIVRSMLIYYGEFVFCFCLTSDNEFLFVPLEDWANHSQYILPRRCCIVQPFLVNDIIPNFPRFFIVDKKIYRTTLENILYIDYDGAVRELNTGNLAQSSPTYISDPLWSGIMVMPGDDDCLFAECCIDHQVIVEKKPKKCGILDVYWTGGMSFNIYYKNEKVSLK
jgi:hypothetical protein